MQPHACFPSEGPRSVIEYSVEFRTLPADSGLNHESLQGVFLNGLSDKLMDELAASNDPDILDSLISLIARLDNCLWECHRKKTSSSPPLTASQLSSPSLTITSPSLPSAPPNSSQLCCTNCTCKGTN